MNNLRGEIKVLHDTKKDLEIQILDWNSTNTFNDLNDSSSEGSDSEEDDINSNKSDYLIRAYGNKIDGTSVTINISGFPPHFYVNIPSSWNDIKVKLFISNLKRKVSYYYKNDILNFDIVKRKKFWGFTNNKQFSFIRIFI